MNFSSPVVALILSAVISLATMGLLLLVPGVPPKAHPLVGLFTFVVSYLLVYLAFEFLVFREIKKLQKLLDKIRKKDLGPLPAPPPAAAHPLQKLNEEIISMATRKQAEIEELKQLGAYRREFLADVGHELKTPLFAAQGFIDTLLDGAAEDEQVRDRFLRKAADSLEGLNELVQQILTLSQLETGVLQMVLEPFDMAALAHEVAGQMEGLASQKGIRLQVECKPVKPFWVEADRQRIRQVLVNLAENALKYGTPGGNVFLGLSLSKDKEHARVTVSDDGPGIPREHLSRIFERFYRVEKSRSKDMGGSGLGLAIVKHVLEAHGTQIRVASRVGKGTQFSFKLKRKKGPLAEA